MLLDFYQIVAFIPLFSKMNFLRNYLAVSRVSGLYLIDCHQLAVLIIAVNYLQYSALTFDVFLPISQFFSVHSIVSYRI